MEPEHKYISTEHIQAMLDENSTMIVEIMELNNAVKTQRGAALADIQDKLEKKRKKLNRNLMTLAKWADESTEPPVKAKPVMAPVQPPMDGNNMPIKTDDNMIKPADQVPPEAAQNNGELKTEAAVPTEPIPVIPGQEVPQNYAMQDSKEGIVQEKQDDPMTGTEAPAHNEAVPAPVKAEESTAIEDVNMESNEAEAPAAPAQDDDNEEGTNSLLDESPMPSGIVSPEVNMDPVPSPDTAEETPLTTEPEVAPAAPVPEPTPESSPAASEPVSSVESAEASVEQSAEEDTAASVEASPEASPSPNEQEEEEPKQDVAEE